MVKYRQIWLNIENIYINVHIDQRGRYRYRQMYSNVDRQIRNMGDIYRDEN